MLNITNFINRHCCTAPPSVVGQNSEIVVRHQTTGIPLLPSNITNNSVQAITPPPAIASDARDEFDNEIRAIQTALAEKTPCIGSILDLRVRVDESSLDEAEKSSYRRQINGFVTQYSQNQPDAGIQEIDADLMIYRSLLAATQTED